MMTTTIRKALASDAAGLSELAMRSKGYWADYDAAFLEACREDLTISTAYAEQHAVYLAEQDGRVAGFYSLLQRPGDDKLDFFYIDPEWIGTGLGRQLWAHLLDTAKELAMSRFTIDSDPHAEGFYQKMGAGRIGEIESTVFVGRKLPLMQVTL